MFEALLIVGMIFFIAKEYAEMDKSCDTIVVKKDERTINNK